MVRTIFVGLVMAAAGCTAGVNDGRPVAPPQVAPLATAQRTQAAPPRLATQAGGGGGGGGAHEEAATSPLEVRWQVLSDAGGRLRAEAIVDRRAVFGAPIEVTIAVPAGLVVASGQTTLQVAAGTPPGTTVLPLEFTYGAVPAGDLLAVADLVGARMGAHATAAYRFGRAGPGAWRSAPGRGASIPGPNGSVGAVPRRVEPRMGGGDSRPPRKGLGGGGAGASKFRS